MAYVACQFCQKLFKHSGALEQHLRDSWCGYNHHCDLCNLSWRDEDEFLRHMSVHVPCQFCQKLFKHSGALEQHLNESWCGYDHHCDLCNVLWRDEDEFLRHMADHVPCQFCQKLFKHSGALEQHLNESWCGYDHHCDLCSLVWRDEDEFLRHVADHVPCQFCQKLFKHSGALEQHLNESWCGYDHHCDLCNLVWRDEDEFLRHMADHVPCQFCQKLFKHSGALEQHLNESWCGYDHHCDLCNLSWRDEGAYQSHMDEHHRVCFSEIPIRSRHLLIPGEPTDRKSGCIFISPTQVYYSHDSISARFSCGRALHETLREILCGETSVQTLPRMQITWKDGKWWAFTGNRRLWVFRQGAAFGVVDDVWMETTSRVLPKKRWTTKNGGQSVYVRPLR